MPSVSRLWPPVWVTEDEIQTARGLLTDPSFVDYSYGLITARGQRG